MSFKNDYFSGRARADTIHMLLALAEVKVEAIWGLKVEWEQTSAAHSLGQMPNIYIGGHIFQQCRALEQFLAKRLGLAGHNAEESAKADHVTDNLEVMFSRLFDINMEMDGQRKEHLKAKYIEDVTTAYMPHFEALVTSQGCFLGDKVTWPDLVFFNGCKAWDVSGVHIDSNKFPKLRDLYTNVEMHPHIQAYLQRNNAV